MSEARALVDAIGHTPLVALQRIGRDLPVPVLVKCEHLNPGGSVKDRLARAIIFDAEARGVLREGAIGGASTNVIVEATAGNTGVGLALVARGRYEVVCVMPEKMSIDKRSALTALGARVIITKNAPPDDVENFRNVAARLSEEHGWFLADQFNTKVNAKAHETTTGPEILEQAGRVGAFVAGAGTGGTITGVGRFLKSRLPAVEVVLADPIGSVFAELVEFGRIGDDAPFLVEGIGGSRPPSVFDPRVVDRAERVSDDESFAMVSRLVREEGLYVGGSSGTAVVAALRVAASGRVRDPVVALLPDAWDRYRSKPWFAEHLG